MTARVEDLMTVGDFSDLAVKRTKVVEAGEWFGRLRKVRGERWWTTILDPKTVSDIGYGISLIALSHKNGQYANEEKGHVLLAEISILASANGVSLPESRINRIAMLKELMQEI